MPSALHMAIARLFISPPTSYLVFLSFDLIKMLLANLPIEKMQIPKPPSSSDREGKLKLSAVLSHLCQRNTSMDRGSLGLGSKRIRRCACQGGHMGKWQSCKVNAVDPVHWRMVLEGVECHGIPSWLSLHQKI